MNLKLLWIDNLISAISSFYISFLMFKTSWYAFIAVPVLLLPVAYIGIQIRFWRTPKRKVTANKNQIISPADGNIIYINHISSDEQFISVKQGRISNVNEIIQTDLIKTPCWQIGINMTPFDVHKNCSPIDGKILLSKHISGKFHSLKDVLSMTENERHSYVIGNSDINVGVIQIASRRVRRIDSYVNMDQFVIKGQWIGMIRFGSQVDVFLPDTVKIKIALKEQVYACKTIIAEII